ncbi:hypothetical protein [Flavobacterium pectinovorum]|uniref:YcxB family protein n=1 Tax=Flavobacterium pectinovorum TaxID=29533 RepID=A0AB36P003_9FLAO|nr:hypothetical protein [Flavobacterium pectinovorum]OXB04284.1 hypothetical protein B0A72_12330 [Flavobacterium pectinovorum]SHL52569.1 hypothetical protein SAMN05444387_0812 [Flavobacterium pectinovorum]
MTLKINYTLDREDYKKAGTELITKRYIFLITYFSLVSVIVSYTFVYKDFNWSEFLFISAIFFFFALIVISIIPDLIKHSKIKKLIDSQPDLLGEKSLEIKPDGIEFNNFYNNVVKVYEWHTIKKTYITKNYSFITLKNRTSFIIKNEDLKESDFIKELKSKIKTSF